MFACAFRSSFFRHGDPGWPVHGNDRRSVLRHERNKVARGDSSTMPDDSDGAHAHDSAVRLRQIQEDGAVPGRMGAVAPSTSSTAVLPPPAAAAAAVDAHAAHAAIAHAVAAAATGPLSAAAAAAMSKKANNRSKSTQVRGAYAS